VRVPVSDLFEAGPPKVATPGYRRGYEKIFGKKAQARREKEQARKQREHDRKVKKEKDGVADRHKKQKRAAKKRKDEKAKAVEREDLTRKIRARERRLAAKEKAKPPKPPGLDTIPAQIAHCMMAVHTKRGKSKEAAWNICRWAMTKYGYLAGPYRKNTKLPKATKQTQKGVRRSFQHGMEKKPLGGGLPGTGISKYNRFIKMFKDTEPRFLPKGART
jgi:hypothetical protein